MNTDQIVLALLVALLQPVIAVDARGKGANNEADLNKEFALTNAPKFETSKGQQHESDRVVGQLTNGYAGTLVLATAGDANLDTPAFLSRYLREFSALNQNKSIGGYDFRFERILARVAGHPEMLDDARLDWDMWRSFLLYESFWDGSDYYPQKSSDGTPVMQLLDSARDLLWNYLDRHAKTLVKDKVRRRWWIEHLTHRFEESEGRHMRRWYLLLLCSHADDQQPVVQSIDEPKGNRGDRPGVPMRKPSGSDPFLVTKKDTKSPMFADALREIARPLGLDFTVWGINLHTMPPTRSLQVHLELAKWPVDESYIIGQESWSDETNGPYEWGVRFFRSVGRRAAYGNVSLPSQDRKDGVYFYVFKKRLYVWPKAQMDAGVLQMLHVAGLIDDVEWKRFQGRGFRELRATLTEP